MSEMEGNRMSEAPTNHPAIRSPERRRLRAFAFDPMSTRLSGRYLTVDVPYERDLKPGPLGDLVHVVDYDGARNTWYQPVDLNDPSILAQGGLRPSDRDPRTHQQVVYAVSMSVIEQFERFMGRRFRWRADRELRLVPHAFEGRNAFFDPERRAVLFGYFKADRRDPGPNLPGQMIFTCLSMDIIAHEVTHAIVHRQRRYYSEATNPDVFAWHEAIADLVAFFHHFTYPDVVADAVAAAQTDLREGGGLLELAREFGHSTGRGEALREAISDREPTPERFINAEEPHERGACFVAGVFDAFLLTYQARIADLLRIATGGSGVLPPGRLHPDLVARVADEAVRNAERFLGMVVRAFDYLPVVDVTFGDVVRAIVTADRRLYPDDAHLLRSSLVEALRRRGIYPSLVTSLTDEALAWPRPAVYPGLTLFDPPTVPPIDLSGVILSATQDLDLTGHVGDLSADTEDRELASSAGVAAVGQRDIAPALVQWAAKHAAELGLDPGTSIELHGIHVAYRQAADRQPRPEVVLKFAQRRRDLEDASLPEKHRVVMRAGTTVIASVDGRVDYLVPKPFPPSDPAAPLEDSIAAAARRFHQEGQHRLRAIRKWLGDLDDGDALNAWTVEPTSQRLTFANLHAGRTGR
jgi:hypothetical protein